ncbi:ParB/RepB/Spo0J family partition protein [uncultured Piscinibacter sp.]|uniref:ParB/RepB/Spo0J family partition protein n=1 Tax=uncultured Piscinibacter sp. TaxID=1131835 RepID=UPI002639E3D5|nr:ParB/RepB/Spo0J family partition protein [uncultured Piscinibacter sp.]
MPSGNDGRPLLLAVSLLYEDAHNPRTGFREESIDELVEDIQQRGVLQPLVVHPADSDGRHEVHFGAQPLRAAIRAGLQEVPVVVRDLPADRHAQGSDHQKRQGLTPREPVASRHSAPGHFGFFARPLLGLAAGAST